MVDFWAEWCGGIGSKLVKLAHHPWCAFEVDEGAWPLPLGQRRVHGSFTLLDPKVGSSDLYARAVERLQQFIPGTFTEEDPAPERVIPFAVHIDELSGRSARPSGE